MSTDTRGSDGLLAATSKQDEKRMMNHRKNLLATLTVAAAALMAPPGPASATILTSPASTTYTGTIHAESINSEFHGPFTSISCTQSTFSANVENHGAGVTVTGKLASLTFSGCKYSIKVLKPGLLEIHATGNGNGTVTSTGTELTVETSIANCLYTTSSTDIGTLKGSGSGHAILGLEASAIPRTGHSFFCGSSWQWTGSYTVKTPSTLLVD